MRNTYSYKIRATAFVVAILLVISIFIADLFRIQVINADEYASKNIYLSSANGTFTSNDYDQFLLGDNYNVYYYSEEQPTDTSKTYWHYDETTGLAVLWN